MTMEKETLNRLVYLKEKLDKGKATQTEKDELLFLLYQHKQITENQYKNYINTANPRDKEELLHLALIVVGILILGYLLSKL